MTYKAKPQPLKPIGPFVRLAAFVGNDRDSSRGRLRNTWLNRETLEVVESENPRMEFAILGTVAECRPKWGVGDVYFSPGRRRRRFFFKRRCCRAYRCVRGAIPRRRVA